MGIIVNEQRNTTALVEKYIGTAYDKMAALYANLDALLALYNYFLNDDNQWLGTSATAPTTRLDGTALQDGDKYFNDTTNNTFVYSNGNWINETTFSITTEMFTIAGGHIVGPDTVITLTTPYTPGVGGVSVYVNGVYQFSQDVDPSGAYEETDASTITFTGVNLELGDVVVVSSNVASNNLDITVGVRTGMYVVETNGQTVLPLPEGMAYTLGNNNLEVYINGLLKFAGYHYEETNTTSVTSYTPLALNDVVIFKHGSIVSNDPDTDPIVVVAGNNTFSSAVVDVDTTNQIVITKGGNTIGDGSGGIYVYDQTVNRNTANGITVIDPGKSFANQGTGTGNGCWIRIYENEIAPQWFNQAYRGMEALQHISAIDGDTVTLLGFYEIGDAKCNGRYIGGGKFVWSSSKAATAHNGGTIISPQVNVTPGSANWYTAPLSGTGCWIRQETSPLSVDWFGAAHDGITDSYLAFNKAKDFGNPEVPAGTYEISGAVVGSFYSYGATVINTGSVTTIKDLLV